MKLLLCALALAAPLAAQSRFAFKEVSKSTLELTEDGKPVFDYNFGGIWRPGNPETSRRSTYLHPVWMPDGTLITDDFNPDHPHHRGISWMWPVVVVDGKTHDLWTVGDIRQRFVRWTRRDASADGAVLAVENGWYIQDRKVVRENVEIRALPVRDNIREMRFVLRFEADGQPLEIAGTPDQNKGFGGFCFRFAKPDGAAKGTVIRCDRGVMENDGVLAPARWAEVEGAFQGKPERGRVEDDPSNPGYPDNGWLMRHGFPFLNPSYPGLKHLTLEPGKPLVLLYKVILYSGSGARRQ